MSKQLLLPQARKLTFAAFPFTGYALCAVGFLFCVMTFYPGFMSPDSIDQWEQGRAWYFWDYHPPLMSAVWGILDRIIPGPFGMLLLHNALFWGGAAVFWNAVRKKSYLLGLGLVLFALMPHVLAFLSTIWKDVGLGVSLFLASGLIYVADQRRSRAVLLASCPLLFYGYAARLNAAPAVLPLALWSGFIATEIFLFSERRPSLRKIMPTLIGLVYFLILSVAVTTTTRILTQGRTNWPYQQILLFDLAALSKSEGKSLFPAYISENPSFSMEKISNAYDPNSALPLISGIPPLLPYAENPTDVGELKRSWLAAVLSHRVAYLQHRWEVFRILMGIKTDDVDQPYLVAGDGYNPPQFKSPRGVLYQFQKDYFWYFSRTLFFRGFFWSLLATCMIYFSLRGKLRGDLKIVFVLSSSGLLFALTYFFFTPTTDFRYLWWTVLSATVSLLFFLQYVFDHLRRSSAGGSKVETAKSHESSTV